MTKSQLGLVLNLIVREIGASFLKQSYCDGDQRNPLVGHHSNECG